MIRVKLKYFFLVLIFTFFACGSSTVQQAGPGDDNPENSDTTHISKLQPISITPPEADFTDPKFIVQGKPSRAIIGRLEGLVSAAPKRSSIYMSIFLFYDEFGLISAIRDAASRGVKLHIMLDKKDSNTPTVNKLASISEGIEIVSINNDIWEGAINHNKFALFSEVSTKKGKEKNVVFTSSENWAPFTEKEFQNAVILSHQELYKAYLTYWMDMKSHAAHGMANFVYREFNAPKDGIRALFLPKRKDGKPFGPDPIVKILDDITDPSSATVQIEMPFWNYGRIAIVNKLQDLIEQGSRVEMVVRSSVKVHDELQDLADQGAYVKMYNYTKVPDVKKIQMHSKVMLIQGQWKGKKTKLVITGSGNFGRLKNNNNNVIILNSTHFNHPQIFERYEDNFDQMKALPGVCCFDHN